MPPDREVNSDKSADQPDRDPYLVSLVNDTHSSKLRQSENIRAVLDEMQGTALRRRTQLLKNGH